MKIILNDYEKKEIAKYAKDMDVPEKLLEQWYIDTMDSNFDSDVHDIFNDNYDQIMREAKGPDYDE